MLSITGPVFSIILRCSQAALRLPIGLSQILVEALGNSDVASRLTDPSPGARAQRKRLFLLFK